LVEPVDNQGARAGIAIMEYTRAFKEQMVRRMIGPPAVRPYVLAQEVGVSDCTLYRWRQQLRDVLPPVKANDTNTEKSPRAWSVKEKLRLVGEAEGFEGEKLGELLRRRGVHLAQVEEWRRLVEIALSEGGERKLTATETKAMAKKVKELERELRRKEKALAEGAAMLFLEKKLQAMGWDERHEDAEPDEKTER
jgi:transposase